MSKKWFYDSAVTYAISWWREMYGLSDDNDGKAQKGGSDNAGLAQLRRCKRPAEALIIPAGMRLVSRILKKECFNREAAVSRAAGLAVVLACLRDKDQPLMIKLGHGKDGTVLADKKGGKKAEGDMAILSQQRLQRALKVETPEDMIVLFRRLLAQAKWSADPQDLACSYLWWGERIHNKWAFQYYCGPGNKSAHSDDPSSISNEGETTS